MSSKDCKCGDPVMHAKVVESGIMMSLSNALSEPDREEYWRKHADLLESKFTTQHGRHYSIFLYGNNT